MAARRSFGRSLVIAGVLTAAIIPATAGAAFADTPPHHNPPQQTQPHLPQHGQPQHNLPQHGQPVHRPDFPVILATTVRNADIRTTAGDRRSRTVDVLRNRGSRVQVACYTYGARTFGTPLWYRTVAPSRGYISAAAVTRPQRAVDRCR